MSRAWLKWIVACVLAAKWGVVFAGEYVTPPEKISGEIPSDISELGYPKIPAIYRLAMSENDKLCAHVAKSLPQINYNGVCDYCLGGVDLFKVIKWFDSGITGDGLISDARNYAFVDINNDEKSDLVVRICSSSNHSDFCYLRLFLGDKNTNIKDFPVNKSGIGLQVSSVSYPLIMHEIPEKNSPDYQVGSDRYYFSAQNIVPFVFEGESYVFMDQNMRHYADHGTKKWIVISRYIGGESNFEFKYKDLKDECYFEVLLDKNSAQYSNLNANAEIE
jgi:hypothetical protein